MVEIGQMLREARMRARIDITEVEEKTKIRAKYLRAMENEDFDLLPGPVYVRSFLRTYGDYLGLDSRMLIDEYRRRYERPGEHDLHPVSALGRERPRERRGGERAPRRWPAWATVALVLVAVLAALVVAGKLGEGQRQSASTRASVRPRVRTHTHARTTKTIPKRTLTAPPRVTLALTATDRVYVCLVNGAGRQLIPGVIYAPGQTIPSERARKLLLTLGNANVVMRVDGRTVPVTPSVNAIGLLITPHGVSSLAPAAQPRCT
jgi:cytoskeleton protein RodZ